MYMTKQELRRRVLAARRRLSAEEIAATSKSIQSRLGLLPPFENAAVVLFYSSLPEEVQTYGMIELALAAGKRTAVPIVQEETHRLAAIEVTTAAFKRRAGAFGIFEPDEGRDCPLPLELVDMVVVPGVAFDDRGGRLGFGGGYYDRLLARCRLVTTFVGLALTCQLVGQVPLKAHDILMDYVITEQRIVCCS
jgi:5-formyltetrahydrofolate cyclo-ligase